LEARETNGEPRHGQREGRIAQLVDHANNRRHEGPLQEVDVVMPGGSPECGGSVVVYLKADGEGRLESLSWTGEGDTISMGTTSLVVERILAEGLSMEEVLALGYDEHIESVGRELIGSRTRNATLGLSIVKAAIIKYRRENPAKPAG
jgi:nitrogen fixation protein NifU and related proteins